ncbi:hypothetical protein [Caballeronia sp. LZ001]|uniref:hypothetical protein n=1 Tax=Caballeronia sp. LZ001 TaxID=3038553 RepID=UPI00285DCC56|nr:hypothetical protein [Caballeronia sp. LZ001]MDR5804938.1 hypothetical protein [Caballeronia sp. LZ001]
MSDIRQQSWKGFTIETRAFPVWHCGMPGALPATYIALVRIGRESEPVADWHLPQNAQRWSSADEAHRESLDYAVHAIDSGRLGEAGPVVGLAA